MHRHYLRVLGVWCATLGALYLFQRWFGLG
jgi:hypothetical protein